MQLLQNLGEHRAVHVAAQSVQQVPGERQVGGVLRWRRPVVGKLVTGVIFVRGFVNMKI